MTWFIHIVQDPPARPDLSVCPEWWAIKDLPDLQERRGLEERPAVTVRMVRPDPQALQVPRGKTERTVSLPVVFSLILFTFKPKYYSEEQTPTSLYRISLLVIFNVLYKRI